jgi:hypothetical protein
MYGYRIPTILRRLFNLAEENWNTEFVDTVGKETIPMICPCKRNRYNEDNGMGIRLKYKRTRLTG